MNGSDTDYIARAISLLKTMTDPRGHALLDAIGLTLMSATVAVHHLHELDEAGRVVRLADNDRWSRKATPDLRSAS